MSKIAEFGKKAQGILGAKVGTPTTVHVCNLGCELIVSI
jgi:hypothetical protein